MGYDTNRERRQTEKMLNDEQKRLRESENRLDRLYYHIWPAMYKRYSFRSVNKKLIVFASSESPVMTDSMRPVYQRLKETGYTCVFFGKQDKPKNKLTAEFEERKYYREFFKCFARCGCLYLDDTFLPAYAVKPRKGQQIVQLWHSCGAFRKWDYAIYEDSEIIDKRPIHTTYTAVSVSSEAVKPAFASAMKCDEETIHAWGAPKTDIYFDEEFVARAREELIKNVPNLNSRIDGRKILFYAPTYRGGSKENAHFQKMLDLSLMQRLLGDEYVLLMKLHPYIPDREMYSSYLKDMYSDFVFEMDKSFPISTALCGTDVLITDYSSIIFEYSLLERPAVFYAYDIKQYKKDADFFIRLRDLAPGPIVQDTMELIEAIQKLPDSFDSEKMKRFKHKYMSGCDGFSTRRVIHFTAKNE